MAISQEVYQRRLMKNAAYTLLAFPVIYAGFMLVKTPTLSDALIVLGLSALSGFVVHLHHKYRGIQKTSSEIEGLEEELRKKQLKMHIENLEEQDLLTKARKDARNTVFNQGVENKTVIF